MSEKTSEEYWEKVWKSADLPRVVEPERDTLRNHSYHDFHRFFTKHLAQTRGKNLIEFGCAQSIWLCYFARHFGFKVTGIDYSPLGCTKASAVLARAGIEGQIEQADFMRPPHRLLGAYDVGVSFGVAEHFDDTAECLSAFRRYLKPGGLLITVIPNLAGILGTAQKVLDRQIYDVHVVLDEHALASAHRRANFDVIDCRYIVCSNFGVLTLGNHAYPLHGLRRFIRLASMGFSAATWAVDRYLVSLPATRLVSPYIVCIARVI